VILVAGAGAVGASVAYSLALRGARGVVLCDRGEVGAGATSKAMGGVRMQFSSAVDVQLARESIAFLRDCPPARFLQVGYLFLATSEAGLAELEQRRSHQLSLGVPVERFDASRVPGLYGGDVLGAVFCAHDGVADPLAATRELVARAVGLGVELREHTDAAGLLASAETVVIACGAWSAALAASAGVELPVRPLVRQLLATSPLRGLPERLPMVVESESGFHFRRRGDRLVLAMADPEPRLGFEPSVDESLYPDRLARLRARYPAAAGAVIEQGWAGLYDMTPDGRPIIGRVADGVYAACGFSGHGFMQSPAAGRALAEEILDGRSELDLSPFRLERFEGEAFSAETLVL
jgi:sarcosine oxidase subunit beta